MSEGGVEADTRQLAWLALDLGLTQLIPLLTGLGLALIVAQLGAESYSAYMIVAAINLTTMIAAGSLIQALFVVGGRAIGRDRIHDYTVARRATWCIALTAGALCTCVSLGIGPALIAGHVDLMISESAEHYAWIVALGLPPTLLTMVLRVHAALFDRARRFTMLYVGGSIVTLVLAWFGAGWGGLSVVGVAIVLGAWLQFGLGLLFDDFAAETTMAGGVLRGAIGELWGLGWPVALVVFMDSLASCASNIIVARFWPTMVPAHSSILLMVTVGLVVPLGLGLAALQVVAVTSVRSGAARAAILARRAIAGAAGYGVIVVVGAIVANILLAVPLLVPGAILLAIQSVIFVSAAVLRTEGLIHAPLVFGAIGYLLVVIGGTLVLGVAAGLGIEGVWAALILGFGFTAVAVLHRALVHFPAP